jgi:hypothetical protein
VAIDSSYVPSAAGLLAAEEPDAALALMRDGLGTVGAEQG